MTAELTALALAGLLQVVQYVLMAVPANLELGPGKTSSRATPTGWAAIWSTSSRPARRGSTAR